MPDLLVGTRDRNVLLECKDGTKPPSARKLTPAQEAWHQAWRGKVAVVTTPMEALEACLGTGMLASHRRHEDTVAEITRHIGGEWAPSPKGTRIA